MTHAITRGLGAALLIVSTAGTAAAQTGAGSIAGTVKDASGGAVPGATVTVASPDKGVEQAGQSNAQGAFVFPLLPPGTYTVSVELSGFKKAAKSNVILPVASRVNVGDLVLEVGNVSEAVTVEANVGRLQIQTESGERSDLVTNAQLRDIALNGRNIVDLMKTMPGVIAGGTVTSSTVTNVVGGFNINGTRSLQHEYTVDGVTNLNLGNNTGALVSVNPDALEEVKVLTSNYQAEYGRAGGGFIALTTRGGTNEYHGGLRYFKRDDRLNANTFFNNARGGDDAGFPRPPYRFNYYGWDFGGPVPIEKSGAHKVFFFAAQEYYDQLVPQTTSENIRVPTAAERAGDFSQTVDGTGRAIPIIDPLTGLPFPGNRIPAGRIYAPGQAVLNMFPMPNTNAAATYNYTSQVPSQYPRREDIVRVDWQIASNTRLSGRWVHNFDDQQFAYGTTTASWNFPLTVTDRKNGPGKTLSFTLTHIFSPTLVNEFIYGAGRGGVDIAPSRRQGHARGHRDQHAAAVSRRQRRQPDPQPDVRRDREHHHRRERRPGQYVGVRPVQPEVRDQQLHRQPHEESRGSTRSSPASTISAPRTRATRRPTSKSNIDFTATGTNPLNTGYPFANALLGVYTSYTQASAKPDGKYSYYDLSGYIQDTWKANSKTDARSRAAAVALRAVLQRIGDGAYFDPALYNAAKAPRLYRPVCVALPCTGNNLRAIDPATPGRRPSGTPSGRSSSASSCPTPATSPTAWA